MNKKTNVLIALLLLLGVNTFAQDEDQDVKTNELDEVVVTDSRFALKRENSGKTVIKITQQEIEQNQGRTFAELINTKSGIEINGSRSNAGQNLGVRVRGGNNRQVLVIIDGVQVSDPSQPNGEYDLRLLDLGNIESIEIVKGAASTLYGSGAATAVINITTKKAEEGKVNFVINSSIGTNHAEDNLDFDIAYFTNGIHLSGIDKKFNYKLGFNQQFTDGFSAALVEDGQGDDFSRYSVDLNLGYNFSDAFSLNVFGNITDIDSDFDDGAFADADNTFESQQYRFGLSSVLNYTKGSVNLNTSYSDFERGFFSAFGPFITDGSNFILDVYNKYNFNNKFYTILGLNVINNEVSFDEDVDFNIIDPYVNVVYASEFGLNVNAGGRLNNHSEYGSNFVFNINPSYAYKLNNDEDIKVFGSYSTSFITPSLSQLFGPFGANPDLDPEENLTIEGGIEYQLGSKLRASVLYFNREEEDVILTNPNTFALFNNPEEQTVEGIEVEVNYNPIESVSIAANYTFVDNSDDILILVPESKLNASVSYNFSPRTFASISYQFTGERIGLFFDPETFVSNPVDLDSFNLVNLSFNHTLKNDKITFFASIDNLFNEDYQEVFGFTTQGFNTRIGLKLRLL